MVAETFWRSAPGSSECGAGLGALWGWGAGSRVGAGMA